MICILFTFVLNSFSILGCLSTFIFVWLITLNFKDSFLTSHKERRIFFQRLAFWKCPFPVGKRLLLGIEYPHESRISWELFFRLRSKTFSRLSISGSAFSLSSKDYFPPFDSKERVSPIKVGHYSEGIYFASSLSLNMQSGSSESILLLRKGFE